MADAMSLQGIERGWDEVDEFFLGSRPPEARPGGGVNE